MFGLDEFAEQLSDAEQTVGGQRHEDDDNGRYVAGDHLVSRRLVFPARSSVAGAAAATQSSWHHCQASVTIMSSYVKPWLQLCSTV